MNLYCFLTYKECTFLLNTAVLCSHMYSYFVGHYIQLDLKSNANITRSRFNHCLHLFDTDGEQFAGGSEIGVSWPFISLLNWFFRQ